MAPVNVKNDRNHIVATVRTHGRTGWIEVKARRRWNATDARNVAAALIAAADAIDAPPPPPIAPVGTFTADTPTEPFRAGRGASREAWAEFAGHLNVTVTEDMTRNDIIAACDAKRAALIAARESLTEAAHA